MIFIYIIIVLYLDLSEKKKAGDTLQKGFEKRFNQGDIVYWCHQDGCKYSVHYGMVDEQFSNAVYVDYLVQRERRRVNDIPINEFENDQRYRKLPKGWSYDTKLFKITYATLTKEEMAFLSDTSNISKPEAVKEAYDKGWLVKDSTIFHGNIETEITKDGFKIVKKYPMWKHHVDHVSIRPDKVYFTYDEAQKEVDENIAEFYRQANLSDYDWSVEQIDKILKIYQSVNGATDEEVKKYRNWLLAMKDVEDIEVRMFEGNVQWKYYKNKRWNNIEL